MDSVGNKKKKGLGNLLKWIIGIISLLIIACTIWVIFFLDSFLKNRITKEVYQSSGGLYNLEIKDLNAEFWSGAITMKDVWLKPNNWNVHAKDRNASTYIPDVNIEFDSVNISSIRWLRYLLNNKKLEIGKVFLGEPSFIIESHFEQKGVKQNDRNFLDLLPGIIAAFTGSLRIDEIYIHNGEVSYDLYSKESKLYQRADSIFVDLKSIVIDTTSKHNALYSKTAWVDIRNYKLRSPDNLVKMDMHRIAGKIEDSLLFVEKITYHRQDSLKSKNGNRINIQVEKVNGGGVDYGNLFREQKIFMRSMKFESPRIDMLSSNSPVKRKQGTNKDSSILDAVVPYLTGSFKIDTLAVNNGSINYKINTSSNSVRQSAHSIYLFFTRVLLDTTNEKGDIYAEDIQLKLKDYKYDKNENKQQLNIASLFASVKDSVLSMNGLFFESKDIDSYLVKTPSIISRGVDYMQMFRKERLDMRLLEINSPIIVLENFSKRKDFKKPGSKAPSNSKAYFQKALGPLSNGSLRIRDLRMNNGNIRHMIHTDSGIVEHESKQVDLLIDKIRVDTVSVDQSQLYDFFSIDMKNYILKYHNQNFRIDIGKMFADSRDKSIVMKNIMITQIRSFGATQRHYFIDTIKFAKAFGFDFNRFFLKQEVHSKKLEVHDMDLDIFLDEGKAIRPKYASKMPNELMQTLRFYIRLDTVRFYNSNVQYVDQDPNMKITGKLSFENMNALVYNFTNDDKLMTEGTPCVFIGKTYLMGDGLLSFRITLPLLSKDFDAYYSINIDSMKGDEFNSLLTLGGLTVREGMILPSEFQLEVNSGVAQGKLRFEYEDLHVNVLDGHLEKSKLKSKLGNIIIKDSNPLKPGKDAEVVSVKGKRVQDDSFFYFLWRMLKDGITETITRDTLYNVAKQ